MASHEGGHGGGGGGALFESAYAEDLEELTGDIVKGLDGELVLGVIFDIFLGKSSGGHGGGSGH